MALLMEPLLYRFNILGYIHTLKKGFLNNQKSKVVSSNLCGTKIPCSVYYSSNPFNTSLNTIFTWSYNITTGLNNIYLTQPVIVFTGNFLILTQNTGKVAIDSSGNATYSDLSWQSLIWNPLNPNSKWRFYLTTMNNFTCYMNSISISHTYKAIGLYNLTMTFLSSNQTFQQVVNITDCKLFFDYF